MHRYTRMNLPAETQEKGDQTPALSTSGNVSHIVETLHKQTELRTVAELVT